jgi:hypothetical protein
MTSKSETMGVPYFIRIWDLRKEEIVNEMDHSRVESIAQGIEPYKVIETYHNLTSTHGCTATIADVLAQIPEDDLEKAVAFETRGTEAYYIRNCDGMFEKASTILYKKME